MQTHKTKTHTIRIVVCAFFYLSFCNGYIRDFLLKIKHYFYNINLSLDYFELSLEILAIIIYRILSKGDYSKYSEQFSNLTKKSYHNLFRYAILAVLFKIALSMYSIFIHFSQYLCYALFIVLIYFTVLRFMIVIKDMLLMISFIANHLFKKYFR